MLSIHREIKRETLLERETALARFPRPRKSALPVAVGYPAAYRVGISNLGFHFVCAGLMEGGNFNVERFFADTSPVTLETGSPLASKAALLISISYEEDYLSVVRILVASGIPPLRLERRGRPLVIVGGPAVSANPFPIAEISDAIALGEGEGTLDAVIRALEERAGREPEVALAELARVPGMLVPGFSHAGAGFKEALSPTRFPRSVVITPEGVFPDTLLVESGRGCPGTCAFCLATSIYRPYRFMTAAAFEEMLASLDAPVRRIGLVSTAVAASPDFVKIVELCAAKGISVSFSSLRAEDLDDEKIRLIRATGTRSVSLAPESGSERVRFALGKKVKDETYLEAAAKLREAGIARFSLYILMGCPGETEEAAIETKSFMERFKRVVGGGSVSVHVNPLVPKAWTPFQFHPMPDERALSAIQERLGRDLRRLGFSVRMKHVRSAIRQAVISMGDERVGRAIVDYAGGGVTWRRALAAAGARASFPHETKGPETSFPWDAISGPVRRGFLFKRFEAISKGEPSDAM